ncbi:MAG: Hpt domain-containing protein [Verrucomicrobiota bacterium]|jgi:HPt (histidine-containing phosphotransfer) domain-containing protein|nr:Hpt domain-containing protein [Verrucomicrobiota bacterium]
MPSTDDIARFGRRVQDLLQEIGPADLVEILDAYLIDTRGRMERLPCLLSDRDCPHLARCAHSIQGGSSIFGLLDLERAALEVELAAGLPESPDLFRLIAALRDRYADLEPTLQAAHATLVASLRGSGPSAA